MNERTYTIKETALVTGLSEDTLRYYERIGLLGPIARAASGHRRYAASDLTWIDFLTKMLSTGMTLESLGRYIELFRQGDGTAAERRTMLEDHARMLEERISQLQETLSILRWKINHYEELMARQKDLASGGRCSAAGDGSMKEAFMQHGQTRRAQRMNDRRPLRARQPVRS
jgi:DNA-binding transcriptional MerR regulator